MKKASLSRLILTILIIFLPLNVVRATSEKTTFTITTGEIELVGGVKVKVDMNVPISIHHQETMIPEEEAEWAVSVSTGEINLQVYIPSPINAWYSVTKKPVPIGSGVDIDIPVPIPGATIKARIKTSMTATLNIVGPATLDRNSLKWESSGSEVFKVKANSGSEGNQIQVIINGDLGISIGLVINIVQIFETEIGLTNIGVFDFDQLSQSMKIIPDWRVLQAQIENLQNQIAAMQNSLSDLQKEHDALLNSPPYNLVNQLTIIMIIVAVIAIAEFVYILKET